MLKALTERAPTARKVRMTLRNMVIGIVVRKNNNSGTRPEVLEVEEKVWGGLHSG